MNIGKVIDSQIQAFVQDLRVIVEKAAMDAVRDAFNAPTAVSRRAHPTRRTDLTRRTSEDVRSMSERLYIEIGRRPGETMITFAQALGTTCRRLNLPARNLIREKRFALRENATRRDTSRSAFKLKKAKVTLRGFDARRCSRSETAESDAVVFVQCG